MSGFSIALNHRTVCPAGGKDYRRFLRANPPDAHGLASCPLALHRDLVREAEGARNDGPRHARLLGWAATVRRYCAEYRALGE